MSVIENKIKKIIQEEVWPIYEMNGGHFKLKLAGYDYAATRIMQLINDR